MKTLNSRGHAHWILPIVVVAVVAGLGSYVYLNKSKAYTPDNGRSLGAYDDYTDGCKPYKKKIENELKRSTGLKCDGQSVDFVKYRLKKNINITKFDSLGNGKDVTQNLAKRYGYKINKTPAVRSIVSWPAGGVAGSSASQDYGDVGIVLAVNKGGSIVVETYNHVGPSKFAVVNIKASSAKKLTYAHTEVDYKKKK